MNHQGTPNRLAKETSPYLLQHAYNPVDWYPWGEEAIAKAKAESKPILVSIGYAACHWCHVMERESFEDIETAAIMNRHFINIKVDREERPDIDQLYMDAVQAITGRGGWPLNVFLTPDLKPFYGGTYFPPKPAHQLNSWREIMGGIIQSWQTRRDKIHEQADSLTNHLEQAFSLKGLKTGNTAIDHAWIIQATQALLKTSDNEWGGFTAAPKFPQSMSIGFLLNQYDYFRIYGTPDDIPFEQADILGAALLALDKMMAGGIYDQLQGGFARYSTDRLWLAPHFEKMLYDNALLIRQYCHAFRITGNVAYAEVVKQTLTFIQKEWQDNDGGFFSAYDADSEGVEGKYYTWSREEIFAILDKESEATIFCEAYDVSDGGNWEHTNILWRPIPWSDLAVARHMSESDYAQMVKQGEKKLLEIRNNRIRPLLDDKKILGWNALMISACMDAAGTFEEESYAEMGMKALDCISKNMSGEGGSFYHNYKNGIAANPAFLDDLGLYAEALMDAAAYSGNHAWLLGAGNIVDYVWKHFSDEEELLFWYTPDYQDDIPFRKKELYDGAIPSGNSVICRCLWRLSTYLDKPHYQERATRMLRTVENMSMKYPGSFGNWAQLLQWSFYGTREIALVGPKAKAFAGEMWKKSLPNGIYQWSTLPHDEFPLLASRNPAQGETAIYVCEHYSCNEPIYHPEDFWANYWQGK